MRPVEGETLVSWLDRYCSELSTSRKDLYEGVGLRPLSGKQPRDHGLRVSEDQAASICAATGIPPHEIQKLTMARYTGGVLSFRETREGADLGFLWARGSGTRYCPACLREAPGVWKLAWRLSSSFACTSHGLLLLDVCPGCGLIPGSRPRLGDVPAPNLCGNAVLGSDGGMASCRANLSYVPPVCLPEGSPILATQSWLDTAIDSGALSPDDLHRLLNDVKLLAARALRVMSAGDLRTWNLTDQVLGLDFEVSPTPRRSSLFRPESASATAHAVSLAAVVLRSDEEVVYVPALRRLFSDREGKAAKKSPSTILRHWGEPSPDLQLKMLKALHTDIRPESALRYGTAGPSPAPPCRGLTHILERARSVPQRFWPQWTSLLRLDEAVGPKILQTGLSIGVLMPGYDRPDLELQRETLGLSGTDNSLSYVCRRFPASARDGLMKAILALANYLDAHPAPIDYGARRRLSVEGLLPEKTWQDIALSDRRCGNDPATASLYVTYRLTGSISEYTERGGQGYFLLQHFIASTPPGILDMLDERAESFLAENGVREPLSWEPPVGLLKHVPHMRRPNPGADPVLESLIVRGLIEPRLISQIENRTVKSVGALIPGPDSIEAQLRHLLDRGESVEDMAVALNRDRRMIIHHISRLGLSPSHGTRAPLDAEGIRDLYLVQRRTQQEIAAATGWNKNTIRRLLLLTGAKARDVGDGHGGSP